GVGIGIGIGVGIGVGIRISISVRPPWSPSPEWPDSDADCHAPTVEAVPVEAAPVEAVKAVPTVEANTSAPKPTTNARVPWDSTGEEPCHQDDDNPHPLLRFASPLMPGTHTMLLSRPLMTAPLLVCSLSPAAHHYHNAACITWGGCSPR